MNPRYEIGQKVVIKLPDRQSLDPRDSTLTRYAGQIGAVINYHWINMRFGEFFYIYQVKIEANDSEIAVHEDEIEERASAFLKDK